MIHDVVIRDLFQACKGMAVYQEIPSHKCREFGTILSAQNHCMHCLFY